MIGHIQSLLNRYLLSDQLTLEVKRMNMMFVFGFLVAAQWTIVRAIEGAHIYSFILQAVFLVSIVIGFVLVNRFSIIWPTIYAMLFGINFLLMPLALFLNGGMGTGMPAMFAMNLAMNALVLSGRKAAVLSLASIVFVISCYLTIYFFPQTVMVPQFWAATYIDHIWAFMLSGMFVACLITIQNTLYRREQDKLSDTLLKQKKTSETRAAVNDMAARLLYNDVEGFETALFESLKEVADCVQIDRVCIWRNVEIDGHLHYNELYCWANSPELQQDMGVYSYENTPKWYELLSSGKHINSPLSDLPAGVQEALKGYGMLSLMMQPVFAAEKFEGFVSFDDCHSSRYFTEDEVDAMRSAALIIGNAVIRNIMTENLVKAREDAQASDRAKSQFLSMMSHEMRTPLNAITGMIAIARGSSELERKDYCLNKMEEASSHLLGVINDVLDVSKLEANKLELALEDFSFSKMIDKVLTVSSFQINQRKINFTLTADETIPEYLHGDEQRIVQVIMNMMSNATKFTSEEGKVTLAFRLLESRPGEGYLIEISVADSGIGISEEQLAKLFQPFQQAESTTSRKFGGTGLGLVIMQNIVALMGGKVSVTSELGAGTTFCVTILLKDAIDPQELQALQQPALAAEPSGQNENSAGAPGTADAVVADVKTVAQAAHTQRTVARDGLAGKNILLVEDVEINREIVVALLEDTGLVFSAATNGIEAVAAFEAQPEYFDAILMDVQMPEMDGLEATRKIRLLEHPRAQKIPIIALTANVFKEDIEQTRAAGMDAHVGKPFKQAELLAILRQFVLS